MAESVTDHAEAADTLRAIGAGEVDALVVSGGPEGERVFMLSTADHPYRMFVENMHDGAATVSADGLVLYANRRLEELLACPRQSIVGSPLETFLAGTAAIGMDEIRDKGGLGGSLEFDLLDANGVRVPVLTGCSPLNVNGDALFCLVFTDLSAQKAQEREIVRLSEAQAQRMGALQQAQAALTRQATHDTLTDLPNRALLIDRTDRALAQASRTGRSTAVLFVDLDRFKQVNDTQGHAAGDATLQGVAATLVASVRPMDTVARIGGDEFVVLAPDIDDHVHAVEMATRLVTELNRRPVRTGERVGASVGVAISAAGRGSAEVLLTEADMAMYQSKAHGGGRVQIFDAELARRVRRHTATRETLREALENGRVVVHYQPIIDLTGGAIAGFEALARIAQRDGAILRPADFMPAAEDSGMVVPLGEQVLERACDDAGDWPAPSTLTIAVNLSARQFGSGDLATIVEERLKTSGLDPERLNLELTETTIIDLHPDVLEQLTRLRDLGVQISLDDFGTGYASLTHLRRLPLTVVKIDQSFVQGLGSDRDDERIVASVVDLAANLGLRSIAEGVETQGQLDRLRELGCDQAQGFHFARPMPADDVPAVMEHAAW